MRISRSRLLKITVISYLVILFTGGLVYLIVTGLFELPRSASAKFVAVGTVLMLLVMLLPAYRNFQRYWVRSDQQTPYPGTHLISSATVAFGVSAVLVLSSIYLFIGKSIYAATLVGVLGAISAVWGARRVRRETNHLHSGT